jgi:predicted dehydrogenase
MLGGVRNSFEVYTTRAAIRSQITPNDALMAFAADPATFGTEYLHEKVESRTGWISASADEDWARGYPQEMQDFVEAIAHDREPLSGIRLAADTVAVIYAAYQSAAEGSRIDLA